MERLLPHLVSVIVCMFAARTIAAPVTLLSANLKADVTQDLTTIGGGPSDHKDAHDAGDLTKRSVFASATAALPFGGINLGASRGNASMDLTTPDDGISLAGSISSIVFVKSTPFTGSGAASASATVVFTVPSPGSYRFSWNATLQSQAPASAHVRADIKDATSALLASIDLAGDIVGNPQAGSHDLALAAGRFTFDLDAGGVANPVAVGNAEGDASTINYAVSLSAAASSSGGGTTIPLPAPLLPGAIGIAAVIWTAGKRSGCSGPFLKGCLRSLTA